MMKRLLAVISLVAAGSALLFCGDAAAFVNLGFSPDSSHFMFAQYGLDASSGKPYAEACVVNLAANDFVSGGVKGASFDAVKEAGVDPAGAFYTVLESSAEVAKRFKIDHLRQGRLLYAMIEGETPEEFFEFRDFRSGASYSINLVQSKDDSSGKPSAAFHISVTRTGKDGKVTTKVVGRPGYKREGVLSYRIRRIVASPDEKAFVFVVEKEMDSKGGGSYRFMVETYRE